MNIYDSASSIEKARLTGLVVIPYIREDDTSVVVDPRRQSAGGHARIRGSSNQR